MNRILAVCDDRDMCQLLAEHLRREGFEVELTREGEQAVQRSLSGKYALVVLDATLSGLSGFDALRRIRGLSQIPVILLTTREESDRIVGLELGADDCLSKPFNPREMIARIRAILRRTKSQADSVAPPACERLSIADIELDKSTRTVLREGKPVALTVVEFDLLEAMMRQTGRVVTRQELVKTALGRSYTPPDRSIDTHISNLRKKLGHKIGSLERIKTIRSVGYIYLYLNGHNKE